MDVENVSIIDIVSYFFELCRITSSVSVVKDSTAARRRVDRDQAELVASQRSAYTFRCANFSASASSRSLGWLVATLVANVFLQLLTQYGPCAGQPFGIATPGLVSAAAAALLAFRRGTFLGRRRDARTYFRFVPRAP